MTNNPTSMHTQPGQGWVRMLGQHSLVEPNSQFGSTRSVGQYTDKTRQDKTRQDKTRQDKTRQDKTRQDKTRQDKTRHSSRHTHLHPFIHTNTLSHTLTYMFNETQKYFIKKMNITMQLIKLSACFNSVITLLFHIYDVENKLFFHSI